MTTGQYIIRLPARHHGKRNPTRDTCVLLLPVSVCVPEKMKGQDWITSKTLPPPPITHGTDAQQNSWAMGRGQGASRSLCELLKA